MGKRNADGSWGPDACLAKLKFGEPYVVLRGQDVLAVEALAYWCQLAEHHGVPAAKVADMRETNQAMIEWQPRKIPD